MANQRKVYSGMDQELSSMPCANPQKVTVDAMEREFERYRDGFWGETWENVYRESSIRGVEYLSRYCGDMSVYADYLCKFKNRQNLRDYWHIRADMSASGMAFLRSSFCLDDFALMLYRKGQSAGDAYCTRVVDTWDEMAGLCKNTDKASFRRMEYLAYEEKLVPAAILLGCMYLRVGLTKYATKVAQFMVDEMHQNCLFLWKQINLCKKLRRSRCIMAYGTMLFAVIVAVLVLLWKVFGVLRFWPFVGLTALFTFVYLLVESGRSAAVDTVLTALGGLLVIVGGGASENGGNASVKTSFACYGWLPVSWQYYLAKEYLDM